MKLIVEQPRGWKEVKDGFDRINQWLDTNGDGKDELMMGDAVCFADLIIVSILMWAKVGLGEESNEWKSICGWNDGKWKRLSEQFSQLRHQA